ncbi:MAG: hypothetical protein HW395_54 [candidate division NC10 bacterium]|nr:hypothetical protein [candidate division NC10 bacterium]
MPNDPMPPPIASIGHECLTCHQFIPAGAPHTCWQGTLPERLGRCPLCGRSEGAG